MSANGKISSPTSSRRKPRPTDAAPPFRARDWADDKVVWRIGRKVVAPAVGKRTMLHALIGKRRVNIHLDNDIIEFFKRQSGGSGYQTLINATLRSVIESNGHSQSLQQVVRQTIQQEFARHRSAQPAKGIQDKRAEYKSPKRK